jgi:hypothetical protein
LAVCEALLAAAVAAFSLAKNKIIRKLSKMQGDIWRPAFQNFDRVRFRKQCRGSVTFWCGFRSPDPYLGVMNPDPAPDPTPDPTPFFSVFKDAKKKFFFSYFFFL